MKQSDNLTKFYRAYHAWANDGAPMDNPHGFVNDCGLCYNARKFDTTLLVRHEMQSQFATAGLDDAMPFCDEESYMADTDFGTHHLNHARIAWVKDHIPA